VEELAIYEKLWAEQQQVQQIVSSSQEIEQQLRCGVVLLGDCLASEAAPDPIETMSTDELLWVPDELNQQLLAAVSSDAAYNDLIYQLEKSFHNNLINLDTWVRLNRQLAREQCLKRALALKIHRRQSLH
jgi:hypothetical protein